jgi:Tol biopolymer transport system component
MSDSGTNDATRCPQCGADFSPASSPLGLCPSCLLKLGVSDPAMTPPSPVESPRVPAVTPVLAIAAPSSSHRRWRRAGLIWIVPVVLVALLAAFAGLRMVSAPRSNGALPLTTVVRFGLPLPDETDSLEGAQFAVSPDGARIVLAARGRDGRSRLWIRLLQSMEWRELARTEGATLPFWSPDSRNVGFFAEKKLKRIDISNGLTQTLCDAPAGRGGTWSREGLIVFAQSFTGPLSRVAAAGGTPRPATTVDQSRGAAAHSWPHFLPDGQRFLFVATPSGRGDGTGGGLFVGSLDSGDTRLIVDGASAAVFAQGFLVYARGTALVAQRFDPGRAELVDDVQQISGAEEIDATPRRGSAFSVSAGGVLVHRSRDSSQSQLTWFDRTGRIIGTAGEPADYQIFSRSPDERRVAVARSDAHDGTHIWLIELDRNVTSRLTIGPTVNLSPLWSPDGARIVFASRRDGVEGLYATDATGGGKEQIILQSPEPQDPTDWSPDGRALLYSTLSPNTGSDLWVLPIGDSKPQPLVRTPSNESGGRFSPDGRWVAYVSDESGKDDVYVRTFPQSDRRWQISAGGGSRPRWRSDGRELFFVSPDGQLFAVDVQGGQTMQFGRPTPLFRMPQADHYNVSHDGQRFLVKMPVRERDPKGLQIVLNWTSELRR